nr:hypothetical protein [Tanacetum cinerariifolium]
LNDRQAQAELYRRYSKAMFNAALRITGDYAEAEDVLQESFLSAFRELSGYKGDSSFGAWLKRIVVNKSINCLRQRRLMLVPLEDFHHDAAPAEASAPHAGEEADELQYRADVLRRCIQELPDGYRVVLSLYLLEGYDHLEIAGILERHRADFDLHEPRPELWAALEKQLHGPDTELPEPVMSIASSAITDIDHEVPVIPLAQPEPRKRWAWAEHYSIAAALAVLILAAGLGEAWKSGQVAKERVGAGTVATLPISSQADAALYLAPSGELVASEVNHSTNARLDTAVRGMETYYVSQLADRKAELSELAPEAVADW